MLTLSFTPEERDLVLDILNNYKSDFRMEITDTSTPEYRKQLKQQEVTLNGVIEKLQNAK
ncbi:hypothetical protein [Dehalogenimonas etheniformans]|uniref:Uncharacterized protein n=1 Tax=Dehalogenimonas etheniformans TaxID=1536648 RepID=A0A2P5P7U3_9CHLR|nr:hypothetical protein [Dehalogenimonas etheniformans]PPD58355.1 hypothetical protein JP09_004405 [Dehalogenimonas etheniformans]QNT76928.1 hypothetical protein HX448_09705 [Dehalogenimonas etheniformans]